jgi:hypothetical protein
MSAVNNAAELFRHVTPPRIEEIQSALAQLAEWGNLESQPDTGRVASISDFYRARCLYRLSQGGEAVESALAVFERALQHRAGLQTIALEDQLPQAPSDRSREDFPIFVASQSLQSRRRDIFLSAEIKFS